VLEPIGLDDNSRSRLSEIAGHGDFYKIAAFHMSTEPRSSKICPALRSGANAGFNLATPPPITSRSTSGDDEDEDLLTRIPPLLTAKMLDRIE
jgi:hypothetical protein